MRHDHPQVQASGALIDAAKPLALRILAGKYLDHPVACDGLLRDVRHIAHGILDSAADLAVSPAYQRDHDGDGRCQHQHDGGQLYVDGQHHDQQVDQQHDVTQRGDDRVCGGLGYLLAVIGQLRNQLPGAVTIKKSGGQSQIAVKQFCPEVGNDSAAGPLHAVDPGEVSGNSEHDHPDYPARQVKPEFGVFLDKHPVNQRFDKFDKNGLHGGIEANADDAHQEHHPVSPGVLP